MVPKSMSACAAASMTLASIASTHRCMRKMSMLFASGFPANQEPNGFAESCIEERIC